MLIGPHHAVFFVQAALTRPRRKSATVMATAMRRRARSWDHRWGAGSSSSRCSFCMHSKRRRTHSKCHTAK